jgi:hypothetical protein
MLAVLPVWQTLGFTLWRCNNGYIRWHLRDIKTKQQTEMKKVSLSLICVLLFEQRFKTKVSTVKLRYGRMGRTQKPLLKFSALRQVKTVTVELFSGKIQIIWPSESCLDCNNIYSIKGV